MRSNWLPAILLSCALGVSGCAAPAGSGPQPFASTASTAAPAGTPSATAPVSPPGVDLDTAASVPLAISADGGHATVKAGSWTAMVVVPAGSASDGASWTVTPLRTAPAGIADALSPGLYVDDGGEPPTGDCMIGFSMPGKAHADATIFKVSADGASSELVATYRKDSKKDTFLVARVSGFSTYGIGKALKPARDATRKKQAKQDKGHYSISVHDTVSFEKKGWQFTYNLDLNLAGGGTTSFGAYSGRATLLFTGAYKETLGGIVTGLGDLRWQGNGSANAILLGELGALTDVRNGLPYEMGEFSGYGSATLKGVGKLKAKAKAPIGTMGAGFAVDDAVQIPYLIEVIGDKVTVEIANVGEFEGNLVRFS